MTIRLNIQADVINITTDVPQPSDSFLVDTNVWRWYTYSSPAPLRDQQARRKIAQYTPYITKILSASSTMFYSGLILAELAHIIEKAEYEAYKRNRGTTSLSIKEYRHNLPNERANVVAEVQSVWSQVEAIGISADLTINDRVTQSALTRFQTQALDGYDLFLLEAISHAESGKIQVLTDDMDYATVAGTQVFTSNGLTIQQAQRQGKLLVR